jgi:CubicO group peptidase (beta-lactamase class C family)
MQKPGICVKLVLTNTGSDFTMSDWIDLPRSSPEEQGVSSSVVLSFVEQIEKRGLELHGFMLLRRGYVIAEGWWAPYKPEYPHAAYSLTKSFTSTAVGFAVQEGLLSTEDFVLPYFAEFATQEIRANMGGLKIKHLLAMTTGHTEDTTRFEIVPSFLQDRPDLRIGDREDRDWVRGFLELPLRRPPGTHFVYNSGASHMLARIVEIVTGQRLPDYLAPRLFEPLGIEKPVWDVCPQGHTTGGWGLRIKTEDIARFGQLLLQNGMWNDKRILSREWLKEAVAKQADNKNPDARMGVTGLDDWSQGYGYQFWRCNHNAYRGDGAFGQFCLVMPDQDAVVAINGGLLDMQAVLNVVWEILLPAMQDRPLAADDSSRRELERKLASLALGEKSGAVGGGWSGTRRFILDPNEERVEEIALHFSGRTCRFEWRDSEGEHTFLCGIGHWEEGNRLAGEPVSAKAEWRDERTFVMELYRIHTPHHDKLTCVFEGPDVRIQHEHLNFVPVLRQLIGREKEAPN